MPQDDALQFAERVIALVDSGRKSATYKLATILALIDDAAAHTTIDAGPPSVLSGKEVARRVIELYWPQTRAYQLDAQGKSVLRQSPQNDIPAKLAAFRHAHDLEAGAPLEDGRRRDPAAWDALERELIAVVIGMPLAKLQRFGEGRVVNDDRFVYEFGWPDEVGQSRVWRDDFDDSIHLMPGVGGWLVRLAPLLRPLVEAKWVELVAKQNDGLVDARQLSEFLFGATRVGLERVRRPLIEQQDGACFYCRLPTSRDVQVDHFLPWSRHPDNTLDNLVAAHATCNNAKSASIAGHEHLEAWADRFRSGVLDEVSITWPRAPQRTLSSVTATYLSLPTATWLWRARSEYERLDPARTRAALLAAST